MRPMVVRVGMFVLTPDVYGLGKLVEIRGELGVVRFLHSTASVEDRLYPLKRLERGLLGPQMRVYWYGPRRQLWHAGRVVGYDTGGAQLAYHVRFPNNKEYPIDESELHTRTLLPNQDPTEALAQGWSETQFFYDRRLAALKALVHARASSRGLTGLTSAAVELIPHQVEVIRRVLSDPIQRYLLADEVGMGKTVEAGAILRQCLLDSPAERAVVLVPRSLVRQWERELTEKFAVDEFPDRVAVRPFEDLPDLNPGEIEVLVIDEAHHLVGHNTDDKLYAQLAKLAFSCRRLFLLSATPVLGDPEAMLRLLHLLDPHTHRDDEPEAFRQKLVNRQEYGRLLMAMNPNGKSFMLKRLGQDLLNAFPGDEVVEALAPILFDAGADQTARGQAVRTLKRHIMETYRIHQRLLRTRRKDVPDWEMLPREGKIDLVWDRDPDLQQMASLLEDWRYRAYVEAQRAADEDLPNTLAEGLALRFARLFDAMGQSASDLVEEIDRQHRAVTRGTEVTFPGDEEILQDLHRVAATAGDLARLEWATKVVQDALTAFRRPRNATKLVVFSSSVGFAARFAAHLTTQLGKDAVVHIGKGSSSAEYEEAVSRVRKSNREMVLVCDRSGEEGLNLHFVDALVHLDLPLAPGRLEQRIGRVDRFGRRGGAIRHFILLPDLDTQNLWSAWQRLLDQGFRLYTTSISDVQFLLEDLKAELSMELFNRGAQGLTDAVERVQQRLTEERTRLDEQYALDQMILADDAQAAQVFDALEAGDDSDRYAELGSWLTEALRLLVKEDEENPDIFRLRWTDRTLLPDKPWGTYFLPALEHRLTFDRNTAVRQPDVRLIRPGSQLVEALRRHLLWEDRGSSFATWRVDSRWKTAVAGEWIGFQLTYQVEFDTGRVAALLGDKVDASALQAIGRRADALFAPWVETIVLNDSLQEETDPLVNEILHRPYAKLGQPGGTDMNLGSRREALFSLVPADRFYKLIKRVRERSESLIWESNHFRQAVADSSQRAGAELLALNGQLARRQIALQRTGECPDRNIEAEIAINQAIVDVVVKPRVRLDAIGCFVISDRQPKVKEVGR